MNNIVKVTIVMPSYNASKYIHDSVNSVINQTEKFWELIIVDDHSIDDTVTIINAIMEKDDRIKLIINHERKGTAFCRNKAIELAEGKYIAFLDADDLWASDKISKQLHIMENHGFKMTYTNYLEFIDGQDPLHGKIIKSPVSVTKKQLLRSNSIGCLTVIVDSKIAKLSLIPISITKRNDYALWLKCLNYTNAYNINSVEAYYRKSNGSLSSGSKFKLVSYHYRVFRLSEKRSSIMSIYLTMRNILYYVIKKGM